MIVTELNRAQLIALKQAYMCDTSPAPTWGDLADADAIPDAVIYAEYAGIDFTPDDFPE